MQATEHHCPKCGRSGTIQEFWALVFDFNNWVQLSLSLVLVLAVASNISLSVLEGIGWAFLALVGMCVSLRRKNFCDVCQIEFTDTAQRLPNPKL